MPRIPKLGTLPSTRIQEGCKGTSDPANGRWERTFGVRRCGFCAKFGACPRRYEAPEAGDHACVADFERAT